MGEAAAAPAAAAAAAAALPVVSLGHVEAEFGALLVIFGHFRSHLGHINIFSAVVTVSQTVTPRAAEILRDTVRSQSHTSNIHSSSGAAAAARVAEKA